MEISSAQSSRNYIRNEVIADASTTLTSVISETFDQLPPFTEGLNRTLLSAYDFLMENGVTPEEVSLILSSLERNWLSAAAGEAHQKEVITDYTEYLDDPSNNAVDILEIQKEINEMTALSVRGVIKQMPEKQLATLDEKRRLANATPVKLGKVINQIREQLYPRKDLSTIYDLIPADKLAIVKGFEPDNFDWPNKTSISNGLRKWIYVLILALEEDTNGKKGMRKAIAAFLNSASQKVSAARVGAVTAYLTGDCRQRATGATLEALEAVENIFNTPKPEPEPEPTPITGETYEKLDPKYDTEGKRLGWRIPEERMIRRSFKGRNPLSGKRVLMFETPQLLEWRELERLGAESQNLTIVERDQIKAAHLRELLPKARVVAATLDDWLVQEAHTRMSDAEYERCQIPRDADTPLDFLGPYVARRYYPDRSVFSGLRVHPMIPMDDPKLNAFFRRPYVDLKQTSDLTDPSDPGFDLVSLDTKGQLVSFKQALKLMFKMGFLRDGSVLCTNFLAQREMKKAKASYQESLRTNNFHLPHRAEQDPSESDALKVQRDFAIRSLIADLALAGRGVLGSRTTGSPHTTFMKTMGDELPPRNPEIMRNACLRHLQAYAKQANGKFIPGDELEDLEFLISGRTAENYLDMLFNLRCRAVFGPMTERLAAKNLRKLGSLDACSYGIPGVRPRTLTGGDAFGQSISDQINAHLTGAMFVDDHDSHRYRASSLMTTDFFRFKSQTKCAGLTPQETQILERAFVTGRTPKSIKPGKVIRSFKEFFKAKAIHERILRQETKTH